MPPNWLLAILSVVLVSLVSLAGTAAVAVGERKLRQAIFLLVSLAVGGLFGDVFIHLLPDTYGRTSSPLASSLYVIAGILMFFVLEKFLRWRHEHASESSVQILPLGYMSLFADGVHNFMDGLLIGASFMAGLPVGLATTLAVILHEIPQEIGDFAVLVHSGLSKKQAIALNFLSATLAIVGTIIAIVVASASESFLIVMVPLTAGGFIYIAGTDLVPELHKELNPSKSAAQLIAISVGIGLMLLLFLVD